MDLLCCRRVNNPAEVVNSAEVDSSKDSVPHYKLTYFDPTMRYIITPLYIRLMFRYAQVPFEDVRIAQHEWPDVKQTTRFGKLPELEVEGSGTLAQSMTIARYLGKKLEFGLSGKDEWTDAKIDEIGDLQKDLVQELSVYVGTALGMRDGDRAVLRKQIYLPTVNRILPIYEQELKHSGSGFFMASGLTWIDFFIAEYLVTLSNVEKNLYKKFPELEAFVRRVQALPQLADYMRTRNQTLV